MALYCWGSTINGELGIGGVEEEHIITPRELDWQLASNVEYISCGSTHSLMVTKDGKVYSCGCNDFGQLGHEQPRKRPHLIRSLENHVITKVCCGSSHSVAVNEWGNVFTWGSNSFGQLGHNLSDESEPVPKLLKALGTKHIIQIAVGNHHNIALTNEGELYAWGLNNNGQLGIGSEIKKIATPTRISSLNGIPIAFIACGGSHTFAISKSGAVFGWGKNTFGQLGIGNEVNRSHPVQLKTLRSIGVRHISAGEDFSVFLTHEGGVLTCGAGSYGQLGHGNRNNDVLPRMVFEMMGTTCTQVACGGRHVLTYVPSRGRIYGFGLGSSGQLGNRSTNNALVPQIVVGPWASPSGATLLDKLAKTDGVSQTAMSFVKRIFSGGDHSFAATTPNIQDNIHDCRFYDPNTQIETMTLDLFDLCAKVGKDDTVDLSLMSSVEIIFKNAACINGSFLVPNGRHMCCSVKNPGVSIADAQRAFNSIQTMENITLKSIIWEGITSQLVPSLCPSPPDVEALRTYLLLPLYHEFINSKNYPALHTPFGRSILNLSKIPQTIVSQWWAQQSTEYFEKLIEHFKNVVIHVLNYNFPKVYLYKEGIEDSGTPLAEVKYEINLETALNVLKLLYEINQNQRSDSVAYETFYLTGISDIIYLQKDYVEWIHSTDQANTFSLCNYAFLFDTPTKKLLLQIDQAMQMHKAMFDAQRQSIFNFLRQSAVSEYIVLNVSRNTIVEDTINEVVKYSTNELKKPLKIKFEGEEGEDAGGVLKEFFMLLIQKVFGSEYGMFKNYDESRLIWFSDGSFEGEEMYNLVGIICGLAIYNFTIINLPFPLALFKKLLKEKIDLSDLIELSPTMGNSMKNILEYQEDDMEEVFDLTFEVSREVYGHVESIALKPGGEEIRVNQDNKVEFVDLYIDYIFNKSVQYQFNGFYEGFMKVCGGPILELFRSYELRSVVAGNENYDWTVFENTATYKEGYTSTDLTIRLFWEVFHELPLEEKKKFLLFLTGSNRIPIDGMKAIRITFVPVSDDKFLPVAHTCFNLLDLPRYQTKEKLKFKLLQAIQHNQGFSLV